MLENRHMMILIPACSNAITLLANMSAFPQAEEVDLLILGLTLLRIRILTLVHNPINQLNDLIAINVHRLLFDLIIILDLDEVACGAEGLRHIGHYTGVVLEKTVCYLGVVAEILVLKQWLRVIF